MLDRVLDTPRVLAHVILKNAFCHKKCYKKRTLPSNLEKN